MSQTHNSRLGAGAILIIIGGIFLLDNMNLIPFSVSRYMFSWQGILIIIGSVILITRPNKTPGFILLAIGGFFLLPEILHIRGFSLDNWWPLILIIIGVMFILRQQGHRKFSSKDEKSGMDVLDDISMFGGGEVVVSSENFQGGKVTAIFGGSSFNLNKATLSDENNVIDIFAMFGGTTFIIPQEWNLKVEVTSIFGGFSDSRKPGPETKIDHSKTLIIKGLIIFGGGEVKSY